jgi:formate dehydrogenase subunit gamma
MATSVKSFEERPPNAIDRLGSTVVHEGELLRHRVYTRFLHWMTGIFFFRMLHPWFGVGFVIFFALQFFNWLAPMRWSPDDSKWIHNIRRYVRNQDPIEAPTTDFFNAGQKLQYWEIGGGCVVYLITGLIMWFPEMTGRWAVAISYVLHDISALIMLFGIFFHVYLSTVGQPGTLQSMTRGTVTERWAWTHHPAWYKRMTGKDARAAYDEAVRRERDRARTMDPRDRDAP